MIVGLGNIGEEYSNTRHNIGFNILDALARASNVVFEDKRYGNVAKLKLKNKTLILLKPSTFMNLSGYAVHYWMKQENIPLEQVLVVVDDIALPFGKLRLKPSGSDAGHNGLQHIQSVLGTSQYARLRFGLGNGFPKGAQAHFVLSKWPDTEWQQLPQRIEQALEMIKSFCLQGVQLTMTQFNNK